LASWDSQESIEEYRQPPINDNRGAFRHHSFTRTVVSTVHIPTNHQRQSTPPPPSPIVRPIHHVPYQVIESSNHQRPSTTRPRPSSPTPNHSTSTPAAQTPISPPNYSRATASQWSNEMGEWIVHWDICRRRGVDGSIDVCV
jgi:hypothetical protein